MRHPKVHEDHLGQGRIHQVQGLCAIRGGTHDLDALVLQDAPEQGTGLRVIVDKEDFRPAAFVLLRCHLFPSLFATEVAV